MLQRLIPVYTCQNVKLLLEISCRGSNNFAIKGGQVSLPPPLHHGSTTALYSENPGVMRIQSLCNHTGQFYKKVFRITRLFSIFLELSVRGESNEFHKFYFLQQHNISFDCTFPSSLSKARSQAPCSFLMSIKSHFVFLSFSV